MSAWDIKRLNLYDEGYKEGGWNDIDAGVLSVSHCSNCEHKGLDYHPMRKPESYRAFAVCPKCGNVQEF